MATNRIRICEQHGKRPRLCVTPARIGCARGGSSRVLIQMSIDRVAHGRPEVLTTEPGNRRSVEPLPWVGSRTPEPASLRAKLVSPNFGLAPGESHGRTPWERTPPERPKASEDSSAPPKRCQGAMPTRCRRRWHGPSSSSLMRVVLRIRAARRVAHHRLSNHETERILRIRFALGSGLGEQAATRECVFPHLVALQWHRSWQREGSRAPRSLWSGLAGVLSCRDRVLDRWHRGMHHHHHHHPPACATR